MANLSCVIYSTWVKQLATAAWTQVVTHHSCGTAT